MSAQQANAETPGPREIEYLSPAAPVSMTEGYFQIGTINHFWVSRRFSVLQTIANGVLRGAANIAEVGCGHGLLQRQLEDGYGKPVTGFDLNEYGLKHNVSRISRVCCYDIHQRNQELRGKFDVILLFDVLEHISDEDSFMDALLFHLAPQGQVIMNVPAGRWAFSKYDTAAGHVRRYAVKDLRAVAQRNNLEIEKWTWWGFPLIPTVAVRKLVLMGKQDMDKINSTGFDPKSPWIDKALGTLASLEWIPQKLAGTSLMAILRVAPDKSASRRG
ncbi:MAG TPA: class I SAM-dependent methyltransferase [Candidatus Acidoferrum sp.]|nr:class I SAM-dependent methyltransferase [Candidatus Acidoferrum sp.]